MGSSWSGFAWPTVLLVEQVGLAHRAALREHHQELVVEEAAQPVAQLDEVLHAC